MEEIYLSYEEALSLCRSFDHLKNTTFISSTSNLNYHIFTINPVPFGEIDEFRELLATFIQTRGGNQEEMSMFEARPREDNFTVVLSAGTVLSGKTVYLQGVNLLTVSLLRFVSHDGTMKYGFPVDQTQVLF